MMFELDGLIPAIVLPMTADYEIHEAALRPYVRWTVDQGPCALAINVDTGEGPHLSHQEKVRVLEVVADEVGDRIPLVAGLAGPFTRQAVAQARDYRTAGASALLVFPIPAYLSSPLDPEIPVRYHEAVAEVGLPLILFQLQPALGGVNFDTETLRALAGIEGVVAIKEASFDARRFLDVVRMVETLPRPITVLNGNDNFLLESLVLGAQGALVGFGAVMTGEQVRMIEAYRAGRHDEAFALGKKVQALADVVFAPPVANYRARLKEALHMLGVIDSTVVRPPLLAISESERSVLRQTLEDVGLLSAAQVATART